MALPTLPRRIPWPTMAAVVIATAIVHLVATFMAMSDTRNAAHARLAARFPVNTMSFAAADAPGQQPLPFMAADARYAICPFDTSAGPVEVRALLPDVGWTLGIYRPDGTSAYFANASRSRETDITLSIVATEDRFMGLTPQALGKVSNAAPTLSVTAHRGVVIVRAPDRGLPYSALSEAALQKAACVTKAKKS